MSACKTCGRYLRKSNKSGYCSDHIGKPPALCSVCAAPLCATNTSGLCLAHYDERRSADSQRMDARIAAALEDKGDRNAIAARLGVGVSRVIKIQQSLPADIPSRRMASIIASVSRHSGVDRADLVGRSRGYRFTHPRQAICLLGMEAGHSSSRVGISIGRDHSTVIHGRDAALSRAKASPDFAALLDKVRADDTGDELQAAIREAVGLTDVGTRTAAPISRPEAPVMPPAAVPDAVINSPVPQRPRNDFRTTGDMDESHKFHRNIAAGSRALRIAIERARAA